MERKFFWVNKIWFGIFFRSKKIGLEFFFGLKNLGRIFLGGKKIWVGNYFWSKKIWVRIFFGSKNYNLVLYDLSVFCYCFVCTQLTADLNNNNTEFVWWWCGGVVGGGFQPIMWPNQLLLGYG